MTAGFVGIQATFFNVTGTTTQNLGTVESGPGAARFSNHLDSNSVLNTWIHLDTDVFTTPSALPITYMQVSPLAVNGASTGGSVWIDDFNLTIVGCVEFVDPNPNLLDATGNIISAVYQLATGGRTISGVAADGVTHVLLRTPSTSSVTLTLESGDGSLSQLGSIGPGTTGLSVTPRSGWVFAIYTPPMDFSSSATNINTRTIQFRVFGYSDVRNTLQLVRPPVVLVHGVWSDPSAWSGLTNFLQQQGVSVCPQCLVNYGSDPDNSAPSFDPYTQSPAIDQLISTTSNALYAIRANGIAVTQVDVIGHSMGGMVARARVRYTSDISGGYYRPANFHGGDFHKIITVGTPHFGSKLADWLIQHQNDLVFESEVFSETLGGFLASIHKPLGPAIYQFQTTSGTLVNIAETDVPSHAIVGVEPSSPVTESLLNFIASWPHNGDVTIDCLLGGNLMHDTIVPISSQEGGLSGSATSSVPGVVHADLSSDAWIVFRAGQHDIGETGSTDFWNQVLQYLRAPIASSGSFGFFGALSSGGFPPPAAACQATSQAASVFRTPNAGRSAIATSATVTLTPSAGTLVKPGDEVQVNFSVVGGNAVTGALFAVGSGLLETNGSGPFSFSFTVSSNAVGTINISAHTFGPGPDNYSASTYVTVQPTGSLASISVEPTALTFSLFGQGQGLSVAGNYGDGIQRNITTAGAGTTYVTQSGSNAVVNVSSNGLVTANGNGQDAIIVSNSGLTSNVVVNVQISNHPPVLNSITNQTLAAGTSLDILVHATDSDSNAIALSASSLPSFAILTDQGSGNGVLHIAPSATDTGVFYTTILAVDDGTPSLGAAVSFFVSVLPQLPFQVVSIQQQGNDILLVWNSPSGTNFVQATSGAPGGGYATDFVDVSAPIITVGTGAATTNYVDVGGATNNPGRYYRIRLAQFVNTDTIGDGIPDWWRAQYFGSGGTNTNSVSCALCDADKTGQDNLFKYVAGLDPTNPASAFVLNIANVLNQPVQRSLLFNPMATGRTYTPQFTTNLAIGNWSPLTGYVGPVTNGGQITVTDTNAVGPQKFYRIDISLP